MGGIGVAACLHLLVGSEQVLESLAVHACTCIVNFDMDKTVVGLRYFGENSHIAPLGVLESVVNQIANQNFGKLLVTLDIERGRVEDEFDIRV